MLVVGLGLLALLPQVKPSSTLVYRKLLASVAVVVRRYGTLRWVAASGALLFGAFSAFWTTLTFFLSGNSYHLQADHVGLFGLFGVAGALAAPLIGKWGDKRKRTSLIYGLEPEARSRINSVFVVCNFVGAAAGSLIGTLAWTSFGWAGPCGVGILALGAALGIHFLVLPKHVARELR